MLLSAIPPFVMIPEPMESALSRARASNSKDAPSFADDVGASQSPLRQKPRPLSTNLGNDRK